MTIDKHQARKHGFREVHTCFDCHLFVHEKDHRVSCEGGVFDHASERFIERKTCDMFGVEE